MVMDNWENEGVRADGPGDESLNTGSAPDAADHAPKHKSGIHNNALYAASMGRAATAQVDPHSNRGLANTGTNISYEGPTAAGGGGSAGSGYTSGQSGADSSIQSSSDYDQAGIGGKHLKTGLSDQSAADNDETENGI